MTPLQKFDPDESGHIRKRTTREFLPFSSASWLGGKRNIRKISRLKHSRICAQISFPLSITLFIYTHTQYSVYLHTDCVSSLYRRLQVT